MNNTNDNSLDITRNFFYSLFSLCFVPWLIDTKKKQFLEMLDIVENSGLGDGFVESAKKLKELMLDKNILNSEYDKLFSAPFQSSVGISASYYNEGYEAGVMLQKTKDIFCELGIIKDTDFNAPEDHFGSLFDAMSYAITNRLASNESSCGLLELQKRLFSDVINPNIDFLIADIVQSNGCEGYKSVCEVLGGFMSFERGYLEIDAPRERASSKVVDVNSFYRKREKREDKSDGSCEI